MIAPQPDSWKGRSRTKPIVELKSRAVVGNTGAVQEGPYFTNGHGDTYLRLLIIFHLAILARRCSKGMKNADQAAVPGQEYPGSGHASAISELNGQLPLDAASLINPMSIFHMAISSHFAQIIRKADGIHRIKHMDVFGLSKDDGRRESPFNLDYSKVSLLIPRHDRGWKIEKRGIVNRETEERTVLPLLDHMIAGQQVTSAIKNDRRPMRHRDQDNGMRRLHIRVD